MRCIYCGAPLADTDFCTGCGADVSLQKRIIRISNLLYNRGLEKASVRDLSGAQSLLRQSLKFNKENIDARNLLGLCCYETGEVVQALVEWVISSNIQPQDNPAGTYLQTLQNNKNRLDTINSTIRKYNQSIEYCREGHEDMAVMQLKKVIAQNPKLVKAYQLLALLYMKYEEWDKARKLLKKAAAIDSTNTTTLRYLAAVQQERGRGAFYRRKKQDEDGPAAPDAPLRYVSGNDVIIAPTTFRDSSTIATVINIFLGVLLGAAVVWFLTVPSVRQSANEAANRQVTDANTSLATVTATVQDLQDQIDSANEKADQAEDEKDKANQQVESYNDLLNVADLFVQGDQTKTIDALGELNADDYDGNGKTLYDDISAQVGDALFSQYFNAGTTAYVNRNYTEAASQLQQAVDSDADGTNSSYHDALYYLGFAYYYSGDSARADETFQKFAEKYPNEASSVQPYLSTNQNAQTDAGQGSSVSQGEAAANTDNAATAQTDAAVTAPQSAGTSAITVYGNSSGTSSSTPQVAWTDPATGQQYDMYGNPISSQ